jgi:hypothetical protein
MRTPNGYTSLWDIEGDGGHGLLYKMRHSAPGRDMDVRELRATIQLTSGPASIGATNGHNRTPGWPIRSAAGGEQR